MNIAFQRFHIFPQWFSQFEGWSALNFSESVLFGTDFSSSNQRCSVLFFEALRIVFFGTEHLWFGVDSLGNSQTFSHVNQIHRMSWCSQTTIKSHKFLNKIIAKCPKNSKFHSLNSYKKASNKRNAQKFSDVHVIGLKSAKIFPTALVMLLW